MSFGASAATTSGDTITGIATNILLEPHGGSKLSSIDLIENNAVNAASIYRVKGGPVLDGTGKIPDGGLLVITGFSELLLRVF